MPKNQRELFQEKIFFYGQVLLDLMNCAEYTHDNGVVSVRVARSGVDGQQEVPRGVDLELFREAVEQWKFHAECRADEVAGDFYEQRIAEADRLLSLIDSQQQATPDA